MIYSDKDALTIEMPADESTPDLSGANVVVAESTDDLSGANIIIDEADSGFVVDMSEPVVESDIDVLTDTELSTAVSVIEGKVSESLVEKRDANIESENIEFQKSIELSKANLSNPSNIDPPPGEGTTTAATTEVTTGKEVTTDLTNQPDPSLPTETTTTKPSTNITSSDIVAPEKPKFNASTDKFFAILNIFNGNKDVSVLAASKNIDGKSMLTLEQYKEEKDILKLYTNEEGIVNYGKLKEDYERALFAANNYEKAGGLAKIIKEKEAEAKKQYYEANKEEIARNQEVYSRIEELHANGDLNELSLKELRNSFAREKNKSGVEATEKLIRKMQASAVDATRYERTESSIELNTFMHHDYYGMGRDFMFTNAKYDNVYSAVLDYVDGEYVGNDNIIKMADNGQLFAINYNDLEYARQNPTQFGQLSLKAHEAGTHIKYSSGYQLMAEYDLNPNDSWHRMSRENISLVPLGKDFWIQMGASIYGFGLGLTDIYDGFVKRPLMATMYGDDVFKHESYIESLSDTQHRQARRIGSTIEARTNSFGLENAFIGIADSVPQLAFAYAAGRLFGGAGKMISPTVGKVAGQVAVMAPLTGMAGKDFYDEAVSNGYSAREAAVFHAIANTTVAAANFGSGWLLDNVARNTAINTMKKFFVSKAPYLVNDAALITEKGIFRKAMELVPGVEKIMNKAIVKKFSNGFNSFASKNYITHGFVNEFVEESAEQMGEIFSKNIFHAYSYFSGSKGDFENVFDEGGLSNAFKETLFAGAIGGLSGAVHGTFQQIGYKMSDIEKGRLTSFADILISGYEDDAKQVIEDFYQKGVFGSKNILYNPLKPTETKDTTDDELKSIAFATKAALLSELEMVKKVMPDNYMKNFTLANKIKDYDIIAKQKVHVKELIDLSVKHNMTHADYKLILEHEDEDGNPDIAGGIAAFNLRNSSNAVANGSQTPQNELTLEDFNSFKTVYDNLDYIYTGKAYEDAFILRAVEKSGFSVFSGDIGGKSGKEVFLQMFKAMVNGKDLSYKSFNEIISKLHGLKDAFTDNGNGTYTFNVGDQAFTILADADSVETLKSSLKSFVGIINERLAYINQHKLGQAGYGLTSDELNAFVNVYNRFKAALLTSSSSAIREKNEKFLTDSATRSVDELYQENGSRRKDIEARLTNEGIAKAKAQALADNIPAEQLQKYIDDYTAAYVAANIESTVQSERTSELNQFIADILEENEANMDKILYNEGHFEQISFSDTYIALNNGEDFFNADFINNVIPESERDFYSSLLTEYQSISDAPTMDIDAAISDKEKERDGGFLFLENIYDLENPTEFIGVLSGIVNGLISDVRTNLKENDGQLTLSDNNMTVSMIQLMSIQSQFLKLIQGSVSNLGDIQRSLSHIQTNSLYEVNKKGVIKKDSAPETGHGDILKQFSRAFYDEDRINYLEKKDGLTDDEKLELDELKKVRNDLTRPSKLLIRTLIKYGNNEISDSDLESETDAEFEKLNKDLDEYKEAIRNKDVKYLAKTEEPVTALIKARLSGYELNDLLSITELVVNNSNTSVTYIDNEYLDAVKYRISNELEDKRQALEKAKENKEKALNGVASMRQLVSDFIDNEDINRGKFVKRFYGLMGLNLLPVSKEIKALIPKRKSYKDKTKFRDELLNLLFNNSSSGNTLNSNVVAVFDAASSLEQSALKDLQDSASIANIVLGITDIQSLSKAISDTEYTNPELHRKLKAILIEEQIKPDDGRFSVFDKMLVSEVLGTHLQNSINENRKEGIDIDYESELKKQATALFKTIELITKGITVNCNTNTVTVNKN